MQTGMLNCFTLEEYCVKEIRNDRYCVIPSAAIRSIQSEAGELVGCIEEDAYSNGWISREQLHAMGEELKMTDYGKYILGL